MQVCGLRHVGPTVLHSKLDCSLTCQGRRPPQLSGMQVCGMWHEGPTVLHSNTPDCIEGVSSIKAERWRTPCGICHRVSPRIA